MMRYFVAYIMIGLISFVQAGDGKGRLVVDVEVISEKFDSKIPEGKCRVTGLVFYHGEAQMNAEVCSYRGKECVLTNKKGAFSLLIDTSEVNVYASIIGAKTSYLKNHEFKSQNHLELRFYIQDQKTAVKKPVIYLYSDRNVTLDLTLETMVEMTFTYPSYKNGWHVNLSSDKGIQVNGTSYPYLFWEGKDYGNLSYAVAENQIEGHIVNTDSIVSYLEHQLTVYDLNSTEATDFVTFWGPILARDKYALVQFVVDDGYDQIASLKSSKSITNERRLFMLYESFPVYPNVNVTGMQPSATKLHRDGITLVEWGGAEVLIPKL